MNVLVTGGAGYIGSVVTEQLLDRGYHVTVADNLSSGRQSHVQAGADFHELNVGDVPAMRALLAEKKIDVLMHFAASSLVGESVADPDKYFRNNMVNSLNLLHAVRHSDCRRFIFSSTAAVYGNPESVPIAEEHPCRPINPYGFSKYSIEQALAWHGSAYGLRYNIFRYFNAAGASARHGEDRDVETHLIPLLIDTALGRRESFKLFGDDYDTPDGSCIRDYIHVLDLAEAHIRAIDNLAAHPRAIYNLGTGRGYSNREVIEMVKTVSGRDFAVQTAPRRAGDPAVLVASAQKAMDELGWQPRHGSLREIVESAWRFNMTNEL